MPDALAPGSRSLVVQGTAGDDDIQFDAVGSAGGVRAAAVLETLSPSS